MTTVRQVAEALASQVKGAIPSIRVHSTVPDVATTLPYAFVTPPAIEYQGLTLTSIEATFELVVLVSRRDDRLQLDLLDAQHLTGAKSIPAAIAADGTLGLTGVHASVLSTRSLGIEEIAGLTTAGVVFEIAVRIS